MECTRKEFLAALAAGFASLGLSRLASAAVVTPAPARDRRNNLKEIQVEWLGHGSFKFVSISGKVILLDPWISTNPKAPSRYRSFEHFGKVDLLLFTHGHVGPDAIDGLIRIARPGALFVLGIKDIQSISAIVGAQIMLAGLTMGLAALYSGIRQGRVIAAGTQAVAKDESQLGNVIIFAAVVETFAIFGFLVSFLMINAATA